MSELKELLITHFFMQENTLIVVLRMIKVFGFKVHGRQFAHDRA